MYRLIVESLLGLKLEVDKLYFTPCLPANWESFILHYRFRKTNYHITILQTRVTDQKISKTSVTVDGLDQPEKTVPLIDDCQDHAVEVRIETGKDRGLEGVRQGTLR